MSEAPCFLLGAPSFKYAPPTNKCSTVSQSDQIKLIGHMDRMSITKKHHIKGLLRDLTVI